MVQWLGFCTPNAGGPGSIPGQGTKIPRAMWRGKKKKKEKKIAEKKEIIWELRSQDCTVPSSPCFCGTSLPKVRDAAVLVTPEEGGPQA